MDNTRKPQPAAPAAPAPDAQISPQLSPEEQAAADKLRHEAGMKFFRRLAR